MDGLHLTQVPATPRWHPALILIAGFIAHATMLARGFVWDDVVLREYQHLTGHWPLLSPDSFGFIRPGKTFLFSLLDTLFGDNPLGGQAFALVALLATALLLWRFALRLVPAPAALIAALIYAVHPFHVEATGWLSALNGTLVVALALVYYTLLIDGPARDPRKPLLLTLIFLAALLIKEDAVAIPAIGLLCLWHKRIAPARPILAAICVQYLLAAAFVLWTRQTSLAGGNQLEAMPYNDLLTSLHAPWMTVLHSLYFAVPFPWMYYHYYAPPLAVFWPLTILGWLLVAALLLAACRRRADLPLPLFALLFALIALAPVCNFLPLHNTWFGVRYLAHAGAGLAILAGWLIVKAATVRPPAVLPLRLAAAAWLLAAVGVSARHHWIWRSDDSLFAMMVLKDDSPMMHAAFANRMFKVGNFPQAEHYARRSVQLGHPRINPQIIMGMAMSRQGRTTEAVALWESLLPANGTNVDLLTNLANHYHEQFSRTGNRAAFDRAEQLYAIACTGRGANAEPALVNRGVLWAEAGNEQRAADIWQQALDRFPNSPRINQNLAIAQKNLAAPR